MLIRKPIAGVRRLKVLRAATRLTLLLVTTAVFSLIFLLGSVVTMPFLQAPFAWRNWSFRNWARTAVQILNINVDITNQPPRAPFLLVVNHLSYIDILILAAQVDCAFIAKNEVAAWPLIGALGRLVNTVFIDRHQRRDVIRAMNRTQELIDRGLGVVLFAEGTSTAGQSVSPFKSSMLEFAAQQNIPVHYASLSYATNVDETSADQSVCWWGDMTFTDHFFRLLQLRGFESQITFGPKPILAGDRRVLAAKLWQAVNAQFTPVAIH